MARGWPSTPTVQHQSNRTWMAGTSPAMTRKLLLDFNALVVDELRPVLDLVLELHLERSARSERRIVADLEQPLAHRRMLHGRVQRAFQLGADRFRNALGDEETPPE